MVDMKPTPVSDDIQLDYVEQGRPWEVPMIMLHGYTDSRRSFDPVLCRLPISVHAIAVSQRGHGDSERPEGGYSARDLAKDVVQLMNRMSISQAVIVGHSMGAAVAQRFAIDYPERTGGLVLAASFFTLQNNPRVLEFWESTVGRLEDPIDEGMVQDFQRSTLARPIPAAFFDTVVRESMKVPARVWKAALFAQMATDFSQELAKIQAPTLLLWGDQDVFVSRRDQEQLLEAIPQSGLTVYAGTGHAPHWEQPERFAEDIRGML
jgi:pimeloyl-ACP methyl ester carboxylesterase